MPQSTRPYPNFNFHVEIGGEDIGQFSEIWMPEITFDVIEYREGGDFTTRKITGRVKYGNIILKRGVTSNNQLYQWVNEVRNGNIDRRTVSIALLNHSREVIKRWVLHEAWPVRYKLPDLDAEGKQEAFEIIELAIENIEQE
jgi:phage tail-like protein